MLEDGTSPSLSNTALEAMGFKLVAHPFALLGSSIRAMKKALEILEQNGTPEDRVSFQELKDDAARKSGIATGSRSGDGADCFNADCFNDDVGFSGT